MKKVTRMSEGSESLFANNELRNVGLVSTMVELMVC